MEEDIQYIQWSERILEILQKQGKNVNMNLEELMSKLNIPQDIFQKELQILSKQNQIQMEQINKKQYIRLTDPEEVKHLKQVREELYTKEGFNDLIKIYELVFKSRGKGMDKKEIINQTGIFAQRTNKLLELLVKGTQLKEVKSKKQKSRNKLFLSYFFEFDDDLEQGILFNDGKADLKLIEYITQEIKKSIKENQILSKIQLATLVKSSTDASLDDSDVEKLISIWLIDQTLETVLKQGEKHFKLSHWEKVENNIFDFPPLTKIPCGSCPVRKECKTGSKISPETCIYFSNFVIDW